MIIIQVDKAHSEFQAKPPALQNLINEALYIFHSLGIPLESITTRRLERMAMAFLAVADVKASSEWSMLKDEQDRRSLRTRDIINYINQNFGEEISSGSYDDIRRKDLSLLVQAGIVVSTSPNSARNNSMRGYAVSTDYAAVIRAFDWQTWQTPLQKFMEGRTTLAYQLSSTRNLSKTLITLPSGTVLEFSPGEHNQLQKAIIEEFLPRYGYGAEVLYIGDTAKKFIVFEKEKLEDLNFFQLAHGELPDVVAYSSERNWLYLIEAVHSSGPISRTRLLTLKALTKFCKADIIYVTSFLNRETFRKFVADIAWETEVWIANDPDHLIHFDGDKFLGPYK